MHTWLISSSSLRTTSTMCIMAFGPAIWLFLVMWPAQRKHRKKEKSRNGLVMGSAQSSVQGSESLTSQAFSRQADNEWDGHTRKPFKLCLPWSLDLMLSISFTHLTSSALHAFQALFASTLPHAHTLFTFLRKTGQVTEARRLQYCFLILNFWTPKCPEVEVAFITTILFEEVRRPVACSSAPFHSPTTNAAIQSLSSPTYSKDRHPVPCKLLEALAALHQLQTTNKRG
eukprot:1158236-Pelagomonas_calceolata.AAC.9